MDAALAASALFMGLTGSLHCASMCGPAFGAIASRSGGARIAGATMSVHAGRLLSYAVAGALVASSVAALGTLQAAGPLLRPLWTLVHVAAIALGLTLIWTARVPRWLSRDIGRAAVPDDARVVRVFRRMPLRGRRDWRGCAGPAFPAACCNRRFSLPRWRQDRSRAPP